MEKIKYNLKPRTEDVVLPKNPGFGTHFTDHVFEMDYTKGKGWHNAVIKPLSALELHPATTFMHYGQAIFEGMKAFRTVDDDVVVFRVDRHLKRLNNSARRLCMPEVDTEFVGKALMELVSIERDWISRQHGESLYIRPFMIGTDPLLGVRASADYKFIILLSPVGAYYPEGFKPVKILATDEYVRAVRKGIGECKTAANYAASLLAFEEARKKGYTQVLWLDGVEQKYIEEVGTMNIFINFENEIVTPKLNGSILPGVTRDSVLTILKDWGMNVTERDISIQEVVDQYNNGTLKGIFGTGTAAIISSVGWLTYKEHNLIINNGEPGELDLKLFDELTSIHYGKTEDKYGWLTYAEEKKVSV